MVIPLIDVLIAELAADEAARNEIGKAAQAEAVRNYDHLVISEKIKELVFG